MDECLPLGSLDAATLRMLLETERTHHAAMEQEIARLRGALARQNEVLIELQQRETERERELGRLRTLAAGMQEQNALLRTQAAVLHQELARLRGTPLAALPGPVPEVKPAAQPREKKIRKKRAPEQNAGRRKVERPNHWVTHAAAQCPRCGEALAEGWVHRRVVVIDVPLTPPLEITEHRILRRQCPQCGTRVLPAPPGLETGRVGRCRFGPRLIAAIATMATVERLPGRMIQHRLQREYGLTISHGGIYRLLSRMADAGSAAYAELQQDIRGSPVVYADETGWRQNGQRTTVWTVSTPDMVYVRHGRRTNQEIDGILEAEFAGTIVCDGYAAYDHFPTTKQRCWAHLVRDLEALLATNGDDLETVAWVERIFAIYDGARMRRPAAETGWGYQAVRARLQRAAQCEALILLLCPRDLDARLPYATLAARLHKHLAELFTFVRDPRVEATNNRAERSLRPLVIAHKVSGGTRSAAGSSTRMTLYSLAATATLQGNDPTAVFRALLLAPTGAPSPLTVPTSTH